MLAKGVHDTKKIRLRTPAKRQGKPTITTPTDHSAEKLLLLAITDTYLQA